MGEEPLAERAHRIWDKDLYDDAVYLKTKIDADELEHGDLLRVTVEKAGEDTDRDTEPANGDPEEEQ